MKKDEFKIALRKELNKIALKKDIPSKIADHCEKCYDIPTFEAMDLITDRVSVWDSPEEILFCLASSVDHFCKTDLVDQYFTRKEIDTYKEFRLKKEKFSFPIVIPAIEVDEERQWIGSITAKTLLEWERLGRIRYNTEKQRVRRQVIRGEEVAYKLDVKEKSVQQIAKLMENGEYIPDTITLDLPEDDESLKFHYDHMKRELIIDKIDHFDISDGFHRLLAMKRCKLGKPNFDYPIELRITLFPIYRTQSFIFQQDQKNKMSVTNSNSMDHTRASNIVVERLNDAGNGCNLSGQIKRSGGILEFSALSDLVEYYWFTNKRKEYTNKDIAEVMSEVKTLLNILVDTNPDFYVDFINYRVLVTYFYFVKGKGLAPKEAAKKVVKANNTGLLKEIKLRKLRKNLFDQIDALNIIE